MPSNNQILKEYFADIAGIDPLTKSINDTIRLALEGLGYSGSLNKMLLAYWTAIGGTGSSFNTILRTALIELGGVGYSINTLLETALGSTSEVWNTMPGKWEDEYRLWDYIG